MDINEGIAQLTEMFKGRDWFHDVGVDQYGRLVVYTKYMCHETLHDVPDRIGKIQVLVHFAASKTATREQFVETPGPKRLVVAEFVQKVQEAQAQGIDTGLLSTMDDETETVFKDLSMRHLQNELDRLEKQCGSNTLQDIFYEIKDGTNAVTNLSARYPEIRKGMERLYDEYGFDVIYEELDG